MIGSNYLGQSYYGQGPAVGSALILQSVTATATAVATISSVLLILKTVTGVAVASASVIRQVSRTVSATAVTVATIASQFIEALDIRNAYTKFLSHARTTIGLSGFKRTSKDLTTDKTTRTILDQ